MRRRGQDGQSTLEFTLVAGAIVGLIFGIVSYAIDMHAQTLAQAAANTGAHTAAVATPAAGRDAAVAYLKQVAPTLIDNPTIDATTTGNIVTVTVDGTARTPVAGWRLHVHGHATQPAERF